MPINTNTGDETVFADAAG